MTRAARWVRDGLRAEAAWLKFMASWFVGSGVRTAYDTKGAVAAALMFVFAGAAFVAVLALGGHLRMSAVDSDA